MALGDDLFSFGDHTAMKGQMVARGCDHGTSDVYDAFRLVLIKAEAGHSSPPTALGDGELLTFESSITQTPQDDASRSKNGLVPPAKPMFGEQFLTCDLTGSPLDQVDPPPL